MFADVSDENILENKELDSPAVLSPAQTDRYDLATSLRDTLELQSQRIDTNSP